MSSNHQNLSVLIAEDDEVDVLIINNILNTYFHDSKINYVTTVAGLDHLLRSNEELSGDLIILDISFPDGTTLHAITDIKEKYPEKKIIITSGQNDVRTAFETLNRGADYYVCKGEDFETEILSAILAANNLHRIETENKKLKDIVFNPDNLPAVMFKTGDLGPEMFLKDFDVFPEDVIKNTDQYLMKLSVFTLTALAQGHIYKEGIFELPAGESKDYRIISLSFQLENHAEDDQRLQERSLIVFALFVPIKYKEFLSSLSLPEDKIMKSLKKITDVSEIDLEYLHNIKSEVIKSMKTFRFK